MRAIKREYKSMGKQDNLFEETKIYQKYLPLITSVKDKTRTVNNWDIPYTIGELSYLTHNHYRYYGKFPSTVAGQLLTQYAPPSESHYVVDNFCGSGTTLVEAKLRGIKSYGVDISWISALVSEVKTKHIDLKKVNNLFSSFNEYVLEEAISEDNLNVSFAKKWFAEDAIEELFRIQRWLLSLPKSSERDFLLVGFLAIVRRVSLAHDAEVRPHINPKKKQRNVSEAFGKKIKDMVSNQYDLQEQTDSKTIAKCFVADNQNLPKLFDDGKCYMLISHPPYLNSFNYRPVFSLEFLWGGAFESDYVKKSEMGLIKSELIAHPANERITEGYFTHLKNCYQSAYDIQVKDAKLAVVIGDCTRNGKLIPVIDNTIDIVKNIGFKLQEVNYRTTHYGLGKYAYKDRADYHGEAEEKRDAIIVFSR